MRFVTLHATVNIQAIVTTQLCHICDVESEAISVSFA